jgi:hypothetical protein
MQVNNLVPFGGKLAVTPLPMPNQPKVDYCPVAQRGIWDVSALKNPSILTNTKFNTNNGDSEEDEAH